MIEFYIQKLPFSDLIEKGFCFILVLSLGREGLYVGRDGEKGLQGLAVRLTRGHLAGGAV